MKTILWLDDIRNPFVVKEWLGLIQYLKEEYLEIENEACEIYCVKTQTEFENYIKENGLPDLISFDNDLGIGNGEGYDCAKWLVEYCIDNNVELPQWYVHSANPVAKENISKLFENFEKYFEMKNKVTAWVARDKDNSLRIYIGECPYKTDCDWDVIYRDGVNIQELDSNSFPQIKWEDEEPTKVELTIKIKN